MARSARHTERQASQSEEPRVPSIAERVETLEARIERLEAALEGLQDSVHRQAVLEHENIGDLRKRTAPEQMARDLSEDARRRGL